MTTRAMKLSAAEARGVQGISEAKFTDQILELARLLCWQRVHFRPATNRRGKWSTPFQGDAGWPDLFLVRRQSAGPRLSAVAAELKVGRRKPTAEQLSWLHWLAVAGVRTFIWYPTPECWTEIEAVLKGEK